MEKPPAFFIPEVTEADQESVYSTMASVGGAQLPPLPKRIYSITFRHDRVVWTARVGQTMSGVETLTKRVKGKRVEQEIRRTDAATVLAIFPGIPYIVWTNGHRTRWENPFYAGEPISVTLFTRPE